VIEPLPKSKQALALRYLLLADDDDDDCGDSSEGAIAVLQTLAAVRGHRNNTKSAEDMVEESASQMH
jgi:hypothetical protein